MKDRSHLTLIKATNESPLGELYGTLFNALADEHEAIERAAYELFHEAIDRGIDPADMRSDGALLQLGLAEIPDGIEPIEGLPPVEYIDSQTIREKERVKAMLLGGDEDECYED